MTILFTSETEKYVASDIVKAKVNAINFSEKKASKTHLVS